MCPEIIPPPHVARSIQKEGISYCSPSKRPLYRQRTMRSVYDHMDIVLGIRGESVSSPPLLDDYLLEVSFPTVPEGRLRHSSRNGLALYLPRWRGV